MRARGHHAMPDQSVVVRMIATAMIWSIIMVDHRTGKSWAIETDLTHAECVEQLPDDTPTHTFTCEK